jgi:hypothetical protein
MALSGARSSCVTEAKNSSFARLASTASSRASRSRASSAGLGALPVVDVGRRADPLDHGPLPVVPGHGARQEPPERAVAPPQPALDLEGVAVARGPVAAAAEAPQVVGVQGRPEPAADRAIGRHAGVLGEAPVDVGDAAVGRLGPHDLGGRVGQKVVLALAVGEVARAQDRRVPPHLFARLVQLEKDHDLRPERVGVEGLRDEVDRPELVGALDAARGGGAGGDEEHGRLRPPLARAQPGERLEPVDAGHLHVEHDEGELVGREPRQRLFARRRVHDAGLERREQRLEREQVRRLVVDEQGARSPDGRRDRQAGDVIGSRKPGSRTGYHGVW